MIDTSRVIVAAPHKAWPRSQGCSTQSFSNGRTRWSALQQSVRRSHRSGNPGILRQLAGLAGWLRVTAAAISFPAAWSALSRRSLGDRGRLHPDWFRIPSSTRCIDHPPWYGRSRCYIEGSSDPQCCKVLTKRPCRHASGCFWTNASQTIRIKAATTNPRTTFSVMAATPWGWRSAAGNDELHGRGRQCATRL